MGAFFFGLVIGYITYRTLRRSQQQVGLSDIATVIGAVGGAAVLALFPVETARFDYYAFGLAAGFFLYLVLAIGLSGKEKTAEFLGD
ncbi:hypothetical protein [Xanthobacter autotrophicus]|uniref:hypothetical protein n=1 Tax=Xanthobacter autotrophicus TaxID=280 RepID=UPI003728E754